jgi:hypothetical protein
MKEVVMGHVKITRDKEGLKKSRQSYISLAEKLRRGVSLWEARDLIDGVEA